MKKPRNDDRLPRSVKGSTVSLQPLSIDDTLSTPQSPELKRFMSSMLTTLHSPPIKLAKKGLQRYQSHYKLNFKQTDTGSPPQLRRVLSKQAGPSGYLAELCKDPSKPQSRLQTPSHKLHDIGPIKQSHVIRKHQKTQSHVITNKNSLPRTSITLPSINPRSFLQLRADLARSVMDF